LSPNSFAVVLQWMSLEGMVQLSMFEQSLCE
jgi:hypothetical protein